MGRFLGVDYGTHRIGIALSDPMGMFASAHDVLDGTAPAQSARAIATLCREKEVACIVVGQPRNMDGSLGPSAEAAAAFADRLKEVSGLPVVLWDERLTSKTAEDVLIEAGTRREKRKGLVDKIAAQILLQHYLDARPA
ncbi:MAG: Holliday junction resolvase RuvX [Kiritimatiellae bacterium]|nr:Holliday junction resolvase RuvX [Kiritimatiellia bacterium]